MTQPNTLVSPGNQKIHLDTKSGGGPAHTSSQSTNTSSPTTLNICRFDDYSDRVVVGTWPIDIIHAIRFVLSQDNHPQQPSILKFEISHEAAQHNWEKLSSHGSLEQLLCVDQQSFTAYGSEFRSVDHLQRVFQHHPLWPQFKSILTFGMIFPLEENPLSSRVSDLESALSFGNHKGVSQNPEVFRKLVYEDVHHGYSIIIPLHKIKEIPGALLCPMNVIAQHTISEHGEIIDKRRACHDLSFRFQPSNSSVNSRVKTDQLPSCLFGHCLMRLINYIVTLRLHFPDRPIVLQKTDWKSAYRRAHLHWSIALQCCSRFDDFAFIPLRAIFGGSPCPSMWSIISESTADLAHFLLNSKDWNPDHLHSPHQHKVPPPKLISKRTPLATAYQLIVDIPLAPRGCVDVYIDDIIAVSLYDKQEYRAIASAVPLAIHTVGRPASQHESIPRHPLVCIRKLVAEGRLEEVKTILGWVINTRSMTIHLPSHKYIAWSKSIKDILRAGKTNHASLDTLIGRLNHLCVILPHTLHFLSRIRKLCLQSTRRRFVTLKHVHIADMNLFLQFLKKANSGVNLNLVAFRQPTHVFYSDACPRGLGGYSHDGWAWRFEIPHTFATKPRSTCWSTWLQQ